MGDLIVLISDHCSFFFAFYIFHSKVGRTASQTRDAVHYNPASYFIRPLYD